jgi:hypothetical protein
LRQKYAIRPRGRPKVDGDILQEITSLALRGWAPGQVYAELAKAPAFRDRLPARRTVERHVAAVTPRAAEPWVWCDDDDAPVVLEALAEVIHRTDGRKVQFSRGEAAWVARVRRAVPDLPCYPAYLLARAYLLREEAEEQAADLDGFLAFAPWRSNTHRQRWEEAISNRWIPGPPWWISYGAIVEAMGVQFHMEE